ncbi:FAD-dependent 5-carboxymethylaminomethyl-2-thiouridine(34) oxidoreductase MnmC [Shewanella sp. YIC-542]|uniref:FAD-dependent 5-carboxymethylaminomethyl-2-thiouridine(34) oxidoreductase MnmC n=1 Tax=Shewanella mytili TaxID=3377111 RepID=UPI00398F4F07
MSITNSATASTNNVTTLYLGGCGTAALPRLLQDCAAALTKAPHRRIHVLMFAADDTTDDAASHLQQLHVQLAPYHHLPLIAALMQQPLLPLAGCQRILLEGGQLTLDIYLSCQQAVLAAMVVPNPKVGHPWISRWYWGAPFMPEMAWVWQLARLSLDDAVIDLQLAHAPVSRLSALKQKFMTAGFHCQSLTSAPAADQPTTPAADSIATMERRALNHQASERCLPFPRYSLPPIAPKHPVAIIGAGIAGSMLALSLAERGIANQVFCADECPGEGASGNRQGALYPLLAPDAGPQNDFFQQGFLFSRQRIEQLAAQGYDIPHDFCGVLQSGFDPRSRAKLHKIATGQPWSEQLLRLLSPSEANAVAGVPLNEASLYYPLGGWVCPPKLTQAALQRAQVLGHTRIAVNSKITALKPHNAQWQVQDAQGQCYGPFAAVVIASGNGMTRYHQTAQLQATAFRGQVSEVPTQPSLAGIKTVLCNKGYLTPAWQQVHCLGASYVKDGDARHYSETEQQDNLSKIQQSYPDATWPQYIAIGSRARVGIRMVTRDHLPMVGAVPDVPALKTLAASARDSHFWQQTAAPCHSGLYVLGALGSRGLCSGPLAAEMLAAELTHQPLPLSADELERLSAHRMWSRKLLKGKPL